MNQPNHSTPARSAKYRPKSGARFRETKIFLAALSTAVTVGLWNLFSGSALQADQAQAVDAGSGAMNPPAGEEQVQEAGLPPIPTLVPLVREPASGERAQAAGTNVQVSQQTDSAAPLRSVGAPTPAVVQKVKPVFDSPVFADNSSGHSGGKKSVATTRSSR